MKAHNEQHDPASAVVKQNLTTQPAAAQEAVAYLDIGAGGYLDLGSDLSEEQLLALPKGRHALAIIGTYGIDGYVAAPVTAAPADTWFADQLTAMGDVIPLDGTPAAPGIDLTPFRELVEACEDVRAASDECDLGEGLEHAIPFHLWNELLSKLDAAQHVIDASPKGALNEQFGSAEGLSSPKGGSDPLQVPDTEGVREILGRMCFQCIRLAQVLRLRGDDIKSRAEDEQAAVLRFLLNHYLASPDKWAEQAQAEIDAIRAKAQAGDAEVQP